MINFFYSIKNKSHLQIFSLLYRSGIIFSIFFCIVIPFLFKYNLLSIDKYINILLHSVFFEEIGINLTKPFDYIAFTNIFLLFGILHILSLSTFTYFILKKKDEYYTRSTLSSKIQTCGYLYTLVGFAMSLINLQTGSLSINTLAPPIGFAIFTSILGWFIGGEFEQSDPNVEANEKFKELARNIGTFSNMVVNATDDFNRKTIDLSNQYIKVSKKFNDLSDIFVGNVNSSLEQNLELLKESTEQISNYSIEAGKVQVDTMEEINKQITASVSKCLETISLSSNKVEKINDFIDSNFGNIIKINENYSSILEGFEKNSTGISETNQSISRINSDLHEIVSVINQTFNLDRIKKSSETIVDNLDLATSSVATISNVAQTYNDMFQSGRESLESNVINVGELNNTLKNSLSELSKVSSTVSASLHQIDSLNSNFTKIGTNLESMVKSIEETANNFKQSFNMDGISSQIQEIEENFANLTQKTIQLNDVSDEFKELLANNSQLIDNVNTFIKAISSTVGNER